MNNLVFWSRLIVVVFGKLVFLLFSRLWSRLRKKCEKLQKNPPEVTFCFFPRCRRCLPQARPLFLSPFRSPFPS